MAKDPAIHLFITDEKSLWDILERANSGMDIDPANTTIRVRGWQPQLLYFPDQEMGHTVSPSMAVAITDFHKSLSRAYAFLLYGKANGRLLTTEDEKRLEIRVIVTDGSNGLEIPDVDVDKMVEGLMGKMTGEEIFWAIIVFIIAYFGHTVVKEWITRHFDAKESREEDLGRISLSEEETKRIGLLTEVISKHSELQQIVTLSDDSKEALVKAIKNETRGRVLGELITGQEARELLRKDAPKSANTRLDGEYLVVDINNQTEDGFVVWFAHPETKEEFSAYAFSSELPRTDEDLLFVALHDKAPVHAVINATVRNSKVEAAFVLKASRNSKE